MSILCMNNTITFIITAMEGLALHREGISPYSGDIFHEVSYTFFNQVYRNLNILL